jgi:hypothetical protein
MGGGDSFFTEVGDSAFHVSLTRNVFDEMSLTMCGCNVTMFKV